MKIAYTRSALDTLENLPLHARKSFYKQAGYLVENLLHPSLRAKKFSESEDLWQAASTKTGGSISRSKAIPVSS